MPSIDVVVPNYNYGSYLRHCVESVLSQQGVVVRVLIIDNASSDSSADVARSLAKDSRIELVMRTENLGPHASFNQGIDWACADYFLLLFSDDFLAPGALRRATDIMESNKTIAFCYGRDLPVGAETSVPHIPCPPERPPFVLHSGSAFIERFCRMGVFQIPGSSVVVRTSAQKQAGHYRHTLPHTDDYEMWLRLALQGTVAEINGIQVGLRTHGKNRSREFSKHQIDHIRHTRAAAESFFEHEEVTPQGGREMRDMARHGLANRAYWCAISRLLKGDMQAAQLLKFAFRTSPRTVLMPPIGYLLRRPDMFNRVKAAVMGGE
jgi:glycosyltransferase involved in cell wall biosynthesis